MCAESSNLVSSMQIGDGPIVYGGATYYSPVYSSPLYAPADCETSGHDGDIDQSTDKDDEGNTPHYAPTPPGSLSPVTPASQRHDLRSDHSGADSDTELMCFMADVAPLADGKQDPMFSWSVLQDRSGMEVCVKGVVKATVTPDSNNRRFNANFTADTGLNGSLAARARMNEYMRRTAPADAEELGRQLKEAQKVFRAASEDKQPGWKLVDSDHHEFACNIIAAYFVANQALANDVISDLPTQDLKRTIEKQSSTIPVYFDTGANCTIAPASKARELGLKIQEGTEATMSGVGWQQRAAGVTVFPSLVKAVMGSRTVNVNINLKAQVMSGSSTEGKVIAGASQFITQFNRAALLVLDPEIKKWGGTMVLHNGARLALSINRDGMMVLGSDPSVCQGGQVSVMPPIEKICAELIRREAAGSGREVKEVMAAVAGSLGDRPVPVRKKQPNLEARLHTASKAREAKPGAACSTRLRMPVTQTAQAQVMTMRLSRRQDMGRNRWTWIQRTPSASWWNARWQHFATTWSASSSWRLWA